MMVNVRACERADWEGVSFMGGGGGGGGGGVVSPKWSPMVLNTSQ